MRATRTLCLLSAAAFVLTASAETVSVRSPDGRNAINLELETMSVSATRDGKSLVLPTSVDVIVDGASLVATGAKTPKKTALKFPKEALETPFYKNGQVSLAARGERIDFGTYALHLVARNDGVAYRFELKKGGTINNEKADFTIPKSARCWFNRTGRGSIGCEETLPEFADAANLKTDGGKVFYLPFVYTAEGKTVAVVDSDLVEYPIWTLGDVTQTEDGVSLSAHITRYPKATERVGGWGRERHLRSGGRWIRANSRQDYLVKAEKGRTLPWRGFILADAPSKLAESDLVFALASPQDPGSDFSWVRPGKVAWDWWNAFDNKGDPQGCTTETYVRFIDFAAKNGVEYVIFDEGWSARLNIWKYSDRVDVPYLIDYAKKKNVGIILWMAWAQAYGEEEKVAEHFANLGAKGFKVDFIDRGDARATKFMTDFAAACAKHKMLLDYHGAYRPVGLHRRFPNVLNYEGIHGLEQMKWAKRDKDMVRNDVAAAFLRMTAGPMDYTPGAMINYRLGDYRGNGRVPGSVGTRAHQMALMALYEAPLQMLADSPTHYEENPECFAFMAKTPVVWQKTVGLGGNPETMACLARQTKDGSWYVAGITNREARDFTFKTDFLGKGAWSAEIFRDADVSDAEPMKYVHEKQSVAAGGEMSFHMAKGGGFVIRFTKGK